MLEVKLLCGLIAPEENRPVGGVVASLSIYDLGTVFIPRGEARFIGNSRTHHPPNGGWSNLAQLAPKTVKRQ
jgi:hypothetical protein